MAAANLVLLGAPGAGKGTVAKMIQKQYGYPHLSTGDMLRDTIEEGTDAGREAASYIEHGKLVPDDIVIGILKEHLLSWNCEEGFILDGFPRTIKQAEELKLILAEKNLSLDAVLNLCAAPGVLIQRLSGRRQCRKCGEIYHIKNMPPRIPGICDKCGGELYQRDDDREETIKVRLDEYEEETKRLVDFYKQEKLVKRVIADKDAEDAFRQARDIIDG